MKIGRKIQVSKKMWRRVGLAALLFAAVCTVGLVAYLLHLPGDLTIQALEVYPHDVPAEGKARVSVRFAQSPGRWGSVSFRWDASGGRIEGDGETVTWFAPLEPGDHTIAVTVSDWDGRVSREVQVSVRLPSPGDALRGETANADDRPSPPPMEEMRRSANVNERIGVLQGLVHTSNTPNDIYANERAFDELASLLFQEKRYREALKLFGETIASEGPGYRRLKHLQKYGIAAFYLGRESEALQAFQAAGLYNNSQSSYFMGALLEKKGENQKAIEAYRTAVTSDIYYPDPHFRLSRLLLENGREREAIQALERASPALGRDRILRRLEQDSDMAELLTALKKSGRMDALEDKRRLTDRERDGPPITPQNTRGVK